MKIKSILTGLYLCATVCFYGQSSWDGNPASQTGVECSAFGNGSLFSNGSFYNTAVGNEAMYWAGYASECIGIGASALKMISTSPGNSVDRCSAIGYQALYSNANGDDNTALGHEALYSNTDGSKNTAVGHSALYSNIVAENNTATGSGALSQNNYYGNATAEGNTAVGKDALRNNTTGSFNTAIGSEVLFSNDAGANNTAVGYQALFNNNGNDNTAVGNLAMYFNGSGEYNTAMGNEALYSNTGGNYNVAFGTHASHLNGNASNNLAIGSHALYSNTESYNVAIGSYALTLNDAEYCVAVGYYALASANNPSNDYNTAVGYYAMNALNNTGDNNTAVGALSGVNSNHTNATAFGYGAIASGNDKIRLGNANILHLNGYPATWTATSDKRFKSNLDYDGVKGLEFIMKLRPVSYNLDTKKLQAFLIKNLPDSIQAMHLKQDYQVSTKVRRSGFIAQEVEKAAQECNYNFNGVSKPKNENDNYSLCYSLFVVPLTKAIQEQNDAIQNQKQNLIELKKESANLESAINKLQTHQALLATTITDTKATKDGFWMTINPNPFSYETTITYNLSPTIKNAKLVVTNLGGLELTSIVIEKTGNGSVSLTSQKLVPGIYLYSIVGDGKILGTKRLVVADK